MFKFNKGMGRDFGGEGRADRVTGHDRFCNQKIALPRYRRRKNPHKRSQAETDLLFELTSYTSGDSSESPSGPSNSYMCRRLVSEIQWPKNTFTSVTHPQEPPVCPPEPDSTMFLETACNEHGHIHHPQHRGFSSKYSGDDQPISSWGSISKFFSNMATSLTSCRNSRRNSDSDQFKPMPRTEELFRPTSYDYNRLGEEVGGTTEMLELHSPRDEMKLKNFPPNYGLIRSEKTAGHTACMNYLKSSKGRYVLLDQLPDIGWRTNRLWYVICDARVNAKRLLVATPSHSRTPVIDSTTKNIMLQVCRSLQHPYVSPILDVETINVDNFDRPFTLVVTPLSNRGSLRDVYHKSNWADHWPNKYCKRGSGLTEGHAQRLSCHILEAMLELRSRGLPPGIGGHVHPGNVVIQHGTARFSGLDNVLLGHNPRALPFISHYIHSDLEAMDSVSFAYILFSMCTGYEVVTVKLTPQNWTDIRDYTQVVQVLAFILENPENRIPSLHEISSLEFYRHVDLRELRSLPLPNIMAGPKLPPVRILLEHLHSNRLQKGKKSRSTSAVYDTVKSSSQGPFFKPLYEPPRSLQIRTFSQSTPSMAHLQNGTMETNHEPKEEVNYRKDSMSGSSQISVYCTPPNSLNGTAKETSASPTQPIPPTDQ